MAALRCHQQGEVAALFVCLIGGSPFLQKQSDAVGIALPGGDDER